MSTILNISDAVSATAQKINAIRTAEGLTIAAIARGAGVNKGALSSFLSGKYVGDNDAVGDKLNSWLRLRAAKAESQSFRLALHVEALHNTQIILGGLRLAHTAADIVVFYGGAGGGKSHAARRYASEYPNVYVVTAEPAICSLSAILRVVAAAVGVADGTCAAMSRGITERLRRTNALLIIDEAHHLSQRLFDQLRCIYDSINADDADFGMVFMGNEPLLRALTTGPAMKQIHSRIGLCEFLATPPGTDGATLLSAILGTSLSSPGELLGANLVANNIGGYRAVIKAVRRAALRTRKPLNALTEKDMLTAGVRG